MIATATMWTAMGHSWKKPAEEQNDHPIPASIWLCTIAVDVWAYYWAAQAVMGL